VQNFKIYVKEFDCEKYASTFIYAIFSGKTYSAIWFFLNKNFDEIKKNLKNLIYILRMLKQMFQANRKLLVFMRKIMWLYFSKKI
jgi:hypothetical protein